MTGRALALLACLCAQGLGAQQSVRSVRLVADLTAGDGSAEVGIDIVLAGADTTSEVPATVLDFGEAAARDLRAGPDPTAVDLTPRGGAAWSVSLPVTRVDGEARSRVTYRVERAAAATGGAVRGHLPVLGVRLLPERTLPGLFQAELRLPPTWRVVEGFPTGLSSTGEPGVYRVDLQVVPSLLSFRARSDGGWRPGLPLVLDVLGLGLLTAFSAVGWRYLRRQPE